MSPSLSQGQFWTFLLLFLWLCEFPQTPLSIFPFGLFLEFSHCWFSSVPFIKFIFVNSWILRDIFCWSDNLPTQNPSFFYFPFFVVFAAQEIWFAKASPPVIMCFFCPFSCDCPVPGFHSFTITLFFGFPFSLVNPDMEPPDLFLVFKPCSTTTQVLEFPAFPMILLPPHPPLCRHFRRCLHGGRVCCWFSDVYGWCHHMPYMAMCLLPPRLDVDFRHSHWYCSPILIGSFSFLSRVFWQMWVIGSHVLFLLFHHFWQHFLGLVPLSHPDSPCRHSQTLWGTKTPGW